jgi:hypothetical protein
MVANPGVVSVLEEVLVRLADQPTLAADTR